jgi:hypothetical protein
MVYRKNKQCVVKGEELGFQVEANLSSDNDWVKMAKLIPWSEFEDNYSENFAPIMGPPAKSFRIALGALIIKEKLGLTDRETVQHNK